MLDVLIGVSASYNRSPDATKEAAEKFENDWRNRSSLCTITIYRWDFCGIDNVKFLYPLAGIPMVAYTLLNAVDQGCRVNCVGNDEVKSLVTLMNDVLKTQIHFEHEGNRPLSLSNSLDQLFSGHLMPRNYFVPGDVPFVKGYVDLSQRNDIIIDFNPESLVRDFEHVKRNFYNRGRVGDRTEWFKEPNLYSFTQRGFPVILPLADRFYANRKEGGLIRAIKGHVMHELRYNPQFRRHFFDTVIPLSPEFLKVWGQKRIRYKGPVNFDKCGDYLSFLDDVRWDFNFAKDIFRLLDIDGLNNDWVLNEIIARNLEAEGRLDSRLITLRTAIQSEVSKDPSRFPLLANFEDLLREYAHCIDGHLPAKHRINFHNYGSLDEFVESYKTPAADELTKFILSSQPMVPS